MKFDGWHRKTIEPLFYFYTISSCVHHFIAIGEFKLKLQSGNAQFGSKSAIFSPVWPWNLTDDLEKNTVHLFYAASSFVHHFQALGEFNLELQSGNAKFGSKSAIFLNLTDDREKQKDNFFYAASSFVHHLKPWLNSNWSYSPEKPDFGSKSTIYLPCDLEIWRMTLKNNRAPLPSTIKFCASFHHFISIQTGVTVRKRQGWVLTFDLWPWPFAWTLLLSLVKTSETFIMIHWLEHSEKGVTNRQTNRRTELFIELLGRS